MLAMQFIEAVEAARTPAVLDRLTKRLWGAHGGGQLGDADAEAVSAAVQARRGVLTGEGGLIPARPGLGHPAGSPRREKMFGLGRPRALDRNAKVRIMHWARCLSRRTEKGRAYGTLTAKAVAVLEALLWSFHNARSGICFPSYETIAEAAHCARSTVAEALKSLEAAGVLTWVQRIKRVREPCPDLLGEGGWRWRVLRTSNAYAFTDPSPAADRPESSKSEIPSGTPNQDIFLQWGVRGDGFSHPQSGRRELDRSGPPDEHRLSATSRR